MRYSLEDIHKIVGGSIRGRHSKLELDHIFFDTRKIAIARKGLFICFSGFKRDGHNFIIDAIQKGVKHFIVEKFPEEEFLAHAQYLQVPSSLDALQTLAGYHRSRYNYPVIGITGSNGKTIVKEWLYTILSEAREVVKSPMSYNSQIGVALSLLQMSDEQDVALIEAAVAKVGDMDSLHKMIQCDIGIFTNIGDAHQAGFESIKDKIQEKSILFKTAKSIVYRADAELIDSQLKTFESKDLINWSSSQAQAEQPSVESTDLEVAYNVKTEYSSKLTQLLVGDHQFYSRFQEPHAIENLIHCIVTALSLDIDPEQIQTGINKLQKVDLRLELKEGSFQNTIIDDSYSFDLISFESALSVLSNHSNQKNKVLIISDIPQKGDSSTAYQTISELITKQGVDNVYHVGKDGSVLGDKLGKAISLQTFASTPELISTLEQSPPKQSIILVKGARSFLFEDIVTTLTKQRHLTELEVNLTALRHNLNIFSQHLNPETKILSIIKANAYGTGSTTLATFLESVGVDYLAVAYTDEGIELREHGIQMPILILNPELEHFKELHRYSLEPEIYSLEQLRYLCEHSDIKSEIAIHIKIDTGMNRLGFQEEDIEESLSLIEDHRLHVKAIMSHLAAADDSSKDSNTNTQLELYSKIVERIKERLGINPICHILNSSGIIRFPESQYDMVRIGKGMYGIDMTGDFDESLERVHRLTATISQIKKVPSGSTIGYGCHSILTEERTIAIVNVGYADGLIRSLGNGKISFLIKNQLASTIGNICMDMCMLDITDLDDIRIGDRVEIFGQHVDIREVAAAGDTIPLEILSKLSKRLKKVYTED